MNREKCEGDRLRMNGFKSFPLSALFRSNAAQDRWCTPELCREGKQFEYEFIIE